MNSARESASIPLFVSQRGAELRANCRLGRKDLALEVALGGSGFSPAIGRSGKDQLQAAF